MMFVIEVPIPILVGRIVFVVSAVAWYAFWKRSGCSDAHRRMRSVLERFQPGTLKGKVALDAE